MSTMCIHALVYGGMTGQTLPWNPEHGDQPKLDVDSQQVESQATCMVFSRIIA